ncbi:MAG: NUDIX domain-containing protein [Verrucomicrobiae bacterium]|nr:NUDIX domain-containing protein [Verrucomicrobiae bacterium]
MPEEEVFGVPRAVLEGLGSFQGFNLDVDRYLKTFLEPKNNGFRARSLAEKDPSFKQIIPYVIISDGSRVLHYVRGKKSGEQRLVAKGSIGIGGHINSGDHQLFHAEPMESYLDAVRREVEEELHVDGDFNPETIGLINDDSTEVGSVHLGVVHLLIRTPEQVRKKEQVITQMEFLPLEELRARRDQLETWSQLAIDALPEILSSKVAS